MLAVPSPTAGRFSMLAIAFAFSLGWLVMYFSIICLPGVGIVLENRTFFRKYNYTVLEARMVNSEWDCDPPKHYLAERTSMTKTPRDCVRFSGSASQAALTGSSGNFSIKESHESASFSVPIEDDTTCRSGCAYIVKCGCFRHCRTADQSDTPTTCWSELRKCMCKCLDSEKDEPIMFAYLGKKEYFTTETLSDDLTLNMKESKYLPGTQFYVVVKEPLSQGTHASDTKTSSTESEDQGQGQQEMEPPQGPEQQDHTPQNGAAHEATPSGLSEPLLMPQRKKPREAQITEKELSTLPR